MLLYLHGCCQACWLKEADVCDNVCDACTPSICLDTPVIFSSVESSHLSIVLQMLVALWCWDIVRLI